VVATGSGVENDTKKSPPIFVTLLTFALEVISAFAPPHLQRCTYTYSSARCEAMQSGATSRFVMMASTSLLSGCQPLFHVCSGWSGWRRTTYRATDPFCHDRRAQAEARHRWRLQTSDAESRTDSTDLRREVGVAPDNPRHM